MKIKVSFIFIAAILFIGLGSLYFVFQPKEVIDVKEPHINTNVNKSNAILTAKLNDISSSINVERGLENPEITNHGLKSTGRDFVPNLQWKEKTVTIDGVELKYAFGEGNPEEVSLEPKDYLPLNGKDGLRYVTPETEKRLYDFLSDGDLPEVASKCSNFIMEEMARNNPSFSPSDFPQVLSPSDLDIERYLIIDKVTGRKEINPEIDNRINDFLNTLVNPMNGGDEGKRCLGINGYEKALRLKAKFVEFGKTFTNVAPGIPASAWNSNS